MSNREPLYNTKQRSCKVMKAVLYADNFGKSVVVWVKIRSHGRQRTLLSWHDRNPGPQRTAVAPLQLSGRVLDPSESSTFITYRVNLGIFLNLQ